MRLLWEETPNHGTKGKVNDGRWNTVRGCFSCTPFSVLSRSSMEGVPTYILRHMGSGHIICPIRDFQKVTVKTWSSCNRECCSLNLYCQRHVTCLRKIHYQTHHTNTLAYNGDVPNWNVPSVQGWMCCLLSHLVVDFMSVFEVMLRDFHIIICHNIWVASLCNWCAFWKSHY